MNGGVRMWFHICPDTIAKQNVTASTLHICLLRRNSRLLRRTYNTPATISASIAAPTVPE